MNYSRSTRNILTTILVPLIFCCCTHHRDSIGNRQITNPPLGHSDSSPDCDLICSAIRTDDKASWRLILSRCQDIDAIACEGVPLIFYAVVDANTELLALLIEQGIDVNVLTNGVSPLTLAILQSDLTMARHLYLAGADPRLTGGKRPDAIQTARLAQILPQLQADPVLGRMLDEYSDVQNDALK